MKELVSPSMRLPIEKKNKTKRITTKHNASKKNFAHPNKGLSKGERNHNQFILNKKKADYRYEMNLEQFENGLTENQPE